MKGILANCLAGCSYTLWGVSIVLCKSPFMYKAQLLHSIVVGKVIFSAWKSVPSTNLPHSSALDIPSSISLRIPRRLFRGLDDTEIVEGRSAAAFLTMGNKCSNVSTVLPYRE